MSEDRGIHDEDLPEDLQPTDDNPLAQPLTEEDDPKSAEELDMGGGKTPEQSREDSEEDSGEEEASGESEG
jgi:hypothetical protein